MIPTPEPADRVDKYYKAVRPVWSEYIESLEDAILRLKSKPGYNEELLRSALYPLPCDAISFVLPSVPHMRPSSIKSHVMQSLRIAWDPQEDVSKICVNSSPKYEDTPVHAHAVELRKQARSLRAGRRQSEQISSTTSAQTPESSPAASSGTLHTPSLSGPSSKSDKLQGVRYPDRGCVITWNALDGQRSYRNLLAVEEVKTEDGQATRGNVLDRAIQPGYFAPDKCQIGHAQGLLYLLGAYTMGGTFLLRIIIGTRFRRCVMLPNHVVVVEDGFPAPSKGVTKAADPERTPTKRVVEKEDSSAISVRDFVHSSAISERMPWDLADVLESSSEGTGNQSAAAIYADFMYQTVRLATERDLNAIAARLPAPSSLNCETYASIIASGNATHVQASEDTLRDLIVYARWSDVSITVEADKVRRPRTPSSRPSFTSAPPAARAGPAAPAAPAASPTPSFTVAAPVAAPTLHGQSPQTRHAISEDSASRAESGQQREAKSNSQDNHKRRKKHRSSPEPRTWDVPRRRDDEDDEPPDHRPGPAIRPRRGGDVAAPSGIRDDRGVQTGQPVGSAGTGRQDDISPDRLHITDPDHLGGASVSAPAWWIQSREDEAGLRSDIAHAAKDGNAKVDQWLASLALHFPSVEGSYPRIGTNLESQGKSRSESQIEGAANPGNDDNAISWFSSTTGSESSSLPPLSLLIETLEEAGVRVVRTSPDAMTTLIRRMVDDCTRVTIV